MGGFAHPRDIAKKTGKRKRVMKWADYQRDIINDHHKSIVDLKNNKGGITLAILFRSFILLQKPEYAGGRVLFVLPVEKLGMAILLDFKHHLADSNISEYYITRPTGEMMREEKSNMHTIFIKNPYNPSKPSRITVMGFSEALAFSWSDVVGVHVSDPGQIKALEQENFFNGLYSRLAVSDGFFIMEGPPGKARRGHFWKVCKHVFKIGDSPDELEDREAKSIGEEAIIADEDSHIMDYKGYTSNIEDSVKAGIITAERQAKFKRMPTDEYNRLFMCVWPVGGGMAFTRFQETDEIEAATL